MKELKDASESFFSRADDENERVFDRVLILHVCSLYRAFLMGFIPRPIYHYTGVKRSSLILIKLFDWF